MRKNTLILVLAVVLSGLVCFGALAAAPIFADNFNAADKLGASYQVNDGEWSVSKGVLSQTSMDKADPKKAMMALKDLPKDIQITAKVRIDSWVEHDMARAGVSLRSDPETGYGYNLLFHQDHERVQFLDDMTAWGESFEFTWEDNTWYWFKLKIEGDVLSGKIWKDGTAEPKDWPFVQDSWTLEREGYPAVNGGSSDGENGATASFDDVTLSAPEK